MDTFVIFTFPDPTERRLESIKFIRFEPKGIYKRPVQNGVCRRRRYPFHRNYKICENVNLEWKGNVMQSRKPKIGKIMTPEFLS